MRNSDIFGWIDKYVLILGMIFINFQVFFYHDFSDIVGYKILFSIYFYGGIPKSWDNIDIVRQEADEPIIGYF